MCSSTWDNDIIPKPRNHHREDFKIQREKSPATKHSMQDSAVVQVNSKQLWLHTHDLQKIKTAENPAEMGKGSGSPTLS